MNEPQLIADAMHGDLEAFNRLVLAYQDLAFHQAYRMMGDPDSAADAVQEAFISAYTHITTYRGGSFKAWLMRIVINACYDELRRRKRRPVTSLEPVTNDDEEIESPRWMTDPGETPEDRAERMQLNRAIQNCLNDLSPDFRAVVALVDVQGYDYEEASSILRTPLGTIKSRLARARARLRDCLQNVWELLPEAFRLSGERVP